MSVQPTSALGAYRALVALHQLPMFQNVDANLLFQLTGKARRVTFEEGEEVRPSPGTDPDERYFLLMERGEILVRPDGVGDAESLGLATLSPGDCFGEMAFLADKPLTSTLQALERSVVIFFMKGDFDALYAESAAFRSAVLHGMAIMSGQTTAEEIGPSPLSMFPATAEVVVTRPAEPDSDLPADAYAHLLARAVAGAFGMPVLALTLGDPAEGEGVEPTPGGEVPLDRLTIDPASLAATLAELGPRYEYVFLLPGPPDTPAWQAVEEIETHAASVRLWTTPPKVDGEGGGSRSQILDTVLLDPGRPKRSRRPFLNPKLTEGRGPRQSTPRIECRLPLDTAQLRRAWRWGGANALERIYRENRPAVDRWARALAGRTVGLALGGGGAWGFAHVALIQELHRRKIPIDIVTGASFGSVVGAYYAALGLDGLDLLVRRGRRLEWISLVSMFSTWLLEEQVARDLGHLWLEQTPIVFHPFATNLTTGQGAPLVRGPLGLAVRASGSAPGVFGPTVIPGSGRYVDGCIVNNVPTIVLYARSAALRIAANVYPRPHPPPALDLGRLTPLLQLDPVGRVLDVGASGSLMLHVDGIRESLAAAVTYEVDGDPWGIPALLGASVFGRAEDIVADALASDPLQEAVDRAETLWKGMNSGAHA